MRIAVAHSTKSYYQKSTYKKYTIRHVYHYYTIRHAKYSKEKVLALAEKYLYL